MTNPIISVVIPIHNEQENIEHLHGRITDTLASLKKSYEIIFTNDGSHDDSAQLLDQLVEKDPHVSVIHFNGNFGQHMAIMAGFEKVRGQMIVTMDADLQNLPEDIPQFIEKMEAGHDVVGGYRMDRQDKKWRLWVSKWHNCIREKMAPKLKMKDEGCMLRGYRRNIVDLMVSSGESSTFIPALAMMYATNPAEVGVRHAEREAGESSYNFYKLIRYNFDLITGFSVVPLQLFTFIGIVVSLLSGLLVLYLMIERIIAGPQIQGVFTLFAILFFLVGIGLMGLGIVGEYIGRIYQEVLKRPRFVIERVVEQQRKNL